MRGLVPTCPPGTPDPFPPLCPAPVNSPISVAYPSVLQGLKILRSLKSALFHQLSPDISSPLWATLLLLLQDFLRCSLRITLLRVSHSRFCFLFSFASFFSSWYSSELLAGDILTHVVSLPCVSHNALHPE